MGWLFEVNLFKQNISFVKLKRVQATIVNSTSGIEQMILSYNMSERNSHSLVSGRTAHAHNYKKDIKETRRLCLHI